MLLVYVGKTGKAPRPYTYHPVIDGTADIETLYNFKKPLASALTPGALVELEVKEDGTCYPSDAKLRGQYQDKELVVKLQYNERYRQQQVKIKQEASQQALPEELAYLRKLYREMHPSKRAQFLAAIVAEIVK